MTDSAGIAEFPDLREGMYQVSPDTLATAGTRVTPSALLILLMGDADEEVARFVVGS
jgi:hypothetical protein